MRGGAIGRHLILRVPPPALEPEVVGIMRGIPNVQVVSRHDVDVESNEVEHLLRETHLAFSHRNPLAQLM